MSALLDVNDLLEEAAAPPPPPRAPSETNFKPTVLVATPSRTARNAISVTLHSVGYRCLTAGDAYGTADWLGRFPEVSLVILDLRLPGFDSIQLCKTIRQGANAPPVVILAKRVGLLTRLRAKVAGAVGVLRKPVRPEELLRLVSARLPLSAG